MNAPQKDSPLTQAEVVAYYLSERKRLGYPETKVVAMRPSDPVRPGMGVALVYEVNGTRLGHTIAIPQGVNWKSRRPKGVSYRV